MKLFRKEQFRDEGEQTPYMLRWTIFKCKLFQIFLHKFLRSDIDCMHDHPWNFISIILKGSYREIYKLEYTARVKYCSVGTILYRKATHIHKVELPFDKPCWTLVLTGRSKRQWGFHTPKGWIQWRKYLTGSKQC